MKAMQGDLIFAWSLVVQEREIAVCIGSRIACSWEVGRPATIDWFEACRRKNLKRSVLQLVAEVNFCIQYLPNTSSEQAGAAQWVPAAPCWEDSFLLGEE
mmetsp:Transcript_49278/g.127010  ORF Transcript_49278/g.127010 Transcript_49278/m.127010 type:complete len:100 (-) Transcript_49278:254-553(-)